MLDKMLGDLIFDTFDFLFVQSFFFQFFKVIQVATNSVLLTLSVEDSPSAIL